MQKRSTITLKRVNVGDQFLVNINPKNICTYICIGKVQVIPGFKFKVTWLVLAPNWNQITILTEELDELSPVFVL